MSSASTDSGRGRDVGWTRQSGADLATLNAQEVERIKLAFSRLATSNHGDVRRLRGFDPPRSRLRVGDWRVMLEVTPGLIRVLRVVHRREEYRKSTWIQHAVPDTGDPDAGETVDDEVGLADTEAVSLWARRSLSGRPDSRHPTR